MDIDVEADVDDSASYVEAWLEYDGGRETLYSQRGPGGTMVSHTIEEDVDHSPARR